MVRVDLSLSFSHTHTCTCIHVYMTSQISSYVDCTSRTANHMVCTMTIPCGRGDKLCDKVLHNVHCPMKAGIEQQSRAFGVPEVLPSPLLHRFSLLLEQLLLCSCLLFPLLPTLLECIQYASVCGQKTHRGIKCIYTVFVCLTTLTQHFHFQLPNAKVFSSACWALSVFQR